MYGYIGHTFPITGEVAGATAATQMPAALRFKCKRVVLLARNTNAIYVGFTSGVTQPNDTSDATTGIQVSPTDYLTLDIQSTENMYYIAASTSAGFTICILT
jgi:hypothetical protein